MNTNGKFVISLDFELFWGVRDKRTIDSYGKSIENVHEIVPELLELFQKYGVKATFATVGFLFAKDKEEIYSFSPEEKPNYKDSNLSPYTDNFGLVKKNYEEDPYHFAWPLIQLILEKYPEHEIGTHTFSHYYCQEEGNSALSFEADLMAAIAIAKAKGIDLKSLVFPRNQYNEEYLSICKDHGITTFRGNEETWFHQPDSEEKTTLKKRIYRTLDCYVNLSGHHTYKIQDLQKDPLLDVTSSRFLRPYMPKGGAILEYLKLQRIKSSMRYAAKKGELYHLWWHPHNFGENMYINFKTLDNILKYYSKLHQKYGFESATMTDYATLN